MMTATPAQVIQQKIIDAGLGSGTNTSDWFVDRNVEPNQPDRAITVTHYGNRKVGRIARTGESDVRPSVQVRVRGLNDLEAQQKAQAIQDMLEQQATRTTVVIGSETIMINNFSVTLPVAYLGPVEESDRQVYVFSGNVTLTRTAP